MRMMIENKKANTLICVGDSLNNPFIKYNCNHTEEIEQTLYYITAAVIQISNVFYISFIF